MDFEAYARQSLRPLLRLAVVLTSDVGLAEDVVQTVLAKAYVRWGHIQAVGDPHAYVRRMVVNEIVSWRRKWARIGPAADTELDAATAPDNRIDDRDELMRALRLLPERQRVAVVLRYFEDMADDDIATVLNCRAVTVRGYIHRALKTMRVDLGPSAVQATGERPLAQQVLDTDGRTS